MLGKTRPDLRSAPVVILGHHGHVIHDRGAGQPEDEKETVETKADDHLGTSVGRESVGTIALEDGIAGDMVGMESLDEMTSQRQVHQRAPQNARKQCKHHRHDQGSNATFSISFGENNHSAACDYAEQARQKGEARQYANATFGCETEIEFTEIEQLLAMLTSARFSIVAHLLVVILVAGVLSILACQLYRCLYPLGRVAVRLASVGSCGHLLLLHES